jgi:hypothetical protein
MTIAFDHAQGCQRSFDRYRGIEGQAVRKSSDAKRFEEVRARVAPPNEAYAIVSEKDEREECRDPSCANQAPVERIDRLLRVLAHEPNMARLGNSLTSSS